MQNIFLVDGFGALMTAVLLSQVLARFERIFGMPKDVLFILSVIAGCFMVYSLFCQFFVKKNKQLLLKIIAIANCLYCIATFGLLVYFYQSMTLIGWSYFIVEIVIIVSLVSLENKIVLKKDVVS